MKKFRKAFNTKSSKKYIEKDIEKELGLLENLLKAELFREDKDFESLTRSKKEFSKQKQKVERLFFEIHDFKIKNL